MRKPCVFPDCPHLGKGRGLCENHWGQAKKNGTLERYPTRPLGKITACPHVDRKHQALGMCHSCYQRDYERRNPDKATNSGNAWRKANPEKARILVRKVLLRRYGMTLEDYAAAWRAQKGRCANPRCGKRARLWAKNYRLDGLQVDHCHRTGKRRGLLCRACNLTLGVIDDHVERMRGLIEYILKARLN